LSGAYYAHTASDSAGRLCPESDWQPLEEHLTQTSDLAASFACAFDAEMFGMAAGLLHDIGKATPEFQQRLRGLALRVDHKSAGAKAALNIYGEKSGKLLAYCVLGHHGGLPDFMDLDSLAPKTPDHDKLPLRGLPKTLPLRKPTLTAQEERGAYLQLLIRMIFSCLVDADYLDTERVMSPEDSRVRTRAADAQGLWLP
jgi:CRISPR-associated endonuclease Cas3-HD